MAGTAGFLAGSGFLAGTLGLVTAAGFLAGAFLEAGFLAMVLVYRICFDFYEASNTSRSLSRFLLGRWGEMFQAGLKISRT